MFDMLCDFFNVMSSWKLKTQRVVLERSSRCQTPRKEEVVSKGWERSDFLESWFIFSQTIIIRIATWVFATQNWSFPTQGLPKSVRVNTIGTIIYIGLNICFFTVFFIVAISEFQKPASEYMNRNLMWTYRFSSWYILSNIISNNESQLYPTIKK